jgi:hypothetical protein
MEEPMTKPELLPFHPLCEEFDQMVGKEFDELVGDIKRRGLRFPIITFREPIPRPDGSISVHEMRTVIIDGRNRARACAEAGVEPRYEEFEGSAEDIPRFVVSANIHRRHLKPDRKRELLKTLLLCSPGKSDRAIAEEIGVNQSTVSRTRKSTDAPASVDGKRVGRDGKARRQPAKKNTKANGAAAPAVEAKRAALAQDIRGIMGKIEDGAAALLEAQARAEQDVGADLLFANEYHRLETANRALESRIKDLQEEIEALKGASPTLSIDDHFIRLLSLLVAPARRGGPEAAD